MPSHRPPSNYEEWLERETKIRMRLLRDFPEVREHSRYRVCADCKEVCLCHEDECPDCGGTRIVKEVIPDLGVEQSARFRCRARYAALMGRDRDRPLP